MKWVTHVVLIAVLAAATLAGIYAIYVMNQADYYAARNFRLLSAWSHQLSATLANYERVFESARAACFQLDFLFAGSPRAERPLAPPSRPLEPVSTRDCLERINAALPSSLQPVRHREVPEPGLFRAYWVDVAQIASAAGSSIVLTYLSNLDRLKTTPGDRFEDTICRPVSTTTQPEAGSKLWCEAAVSLTQLAAQLGIGEENVFDEIVLADQAGKVHYQHGASSFQFVNLRPWIHSSSPSGTTGSSPSPADAKHPGAESLAERLPLRQEVNVGGIAYHLFAQPVLLPAHGAEGQTGGHAGHPHHLIIAGFVKADRLHQQAFAIPYTVLVLVVFLVLALAIGLPFLKLKTMGLQDRIRPVEVVTTMGACLFATALLTFFVLDTYAYWRIKTQKDEELKTFAQAVAENLHAEIGTTVGWMTGLNQWICASHEKAATSAVFFEQPLRANILRVPPRLPAFDSALSPDPIMIFWVDRNGRQRAKWTVRARPTPLIDIANREYVRQVRQGELWAVPDDRGIRHRLWIQPIYSRTTGEFSVIVSQRTATDCPTFDRAYPVTAMQIRLSSVMQPVVPPGFGFAVVRDRDGTVLFHTEKRRALRENFFEETDDDPTLDALIFGRTSGLVGGRYWGVGHRLYVKPLDGLPWTLVTYMHKDLLRTFNFEVLVVSASFFLCYAGVFLVLVLLVGLILSAVKTGRAGWLWPRIDFQDRYHLLIGINGALALGFLVSLALERSGWTWGLGWALLVPLVAAPAAYFTLTRSSCRIAASIPTILRDHRHSYAVMVATMMVTFSLIPAVGLFTIAHDAEMELLVKHGQLGLARAMEARDRRLREFYRDIEIGQDEGGHRPTWHAFLDARRGLRDSNPPQRPRDIYAHVLFRDASHPGTTIRKRGDHSGCPAAGADTESNAVEKAARTLWFKARALFNAPSRETAGLILHHAHDPPFAWEASTPPCVSLVYGDLQVTSMVPTLDLPSLRTILEWRDASVSSFVAAGVLAVVVLAFLLAGFWFVLYRLPRFVADQVFLLSFEPPLDWDTFHCLTRDSSGRRPHLVIIGPPGSGKSRFVQERRWHCIDVRAIKDKPDWLSAAPVAAALHDKEPRTVAIDHFECHGGSPGHDLKKLAVLEALLAAGHRVCVISTVNPLDSLTAASSSPQEEAATEGTAPHRLARIFQSFMIVHYPFLRGGPAMNAMSTWREHLDGRARAMVAEEQETLLRPWYHAVWTWCTDEEKIALFHLAKDRFLHANNPTLRTLLRKGLAVFNPDLQVMSEGFRRFILGAAQYEQAVQLEQRTPGSFWQALSWPLGIVLLLVVVFLIMTQEQVRSAAGASLSLLPAVLPVLIKVLGALQKPKAG